MDVDLDRIGLVDGLRVVAIHARVVDALLAQVVLEGLDGAVGLGFGRILHLHLQHQVAAAAQIQAQMDVLGHVGLQVRERLGQPNDPVHTQQDHDHNHRHPPNQSAVHVSWSILQACYFFSGTRPETALLAI